MRIPLRPKVYLRWQIFSIPGFAGRESFEKYRFFALCRSKDNGQRSSFWTIRRSWLQKGRSFFSQGRINR